MATRVRPAERSHRIRSGGPGGDALGSLTELGAQPLDGTTDFLADEKTSLRSDTSRTSRRTPQRRFRTRHGTPLTTWVLLGTSTSPAGLSRFELTPGCVGDIEPGAVEAVTPAVRQ